MDLISYAEMDKISSELIETWHAELPNVDQRLVQIASQFPYYMIAGAENEMRIECAAVDYDGHYVAFVLSRGSDVGFASSTGNFNCDDEGDFSDLLTTVAESYARYTLEQYRRAA